MICLGNRERMGHLVVVFAAVVLMAGLATPAAALVYDVQLTTTLFGDLDQNDVPVIGACACGPTAAVNSFVYLQNAYPGIYGNSLVPVGAAQGVDHNGDAFVDSYDDMAAVAATLGGLNYMNTKCPGGTWDDMFIYGKQKYVEEQLPGMTDYAAEMSGTWAFPGTRPGDEIPPITKPSWVEDNKNPTWQFLYNNLVGLDGVEAGPGEDVEILITDGDWGHFLTLTSFHWDDVNGDSIIDSTEGAWIDYIDPGTGLNAQSSLCQSSYGGQLLVNYSTMYSNAQLVMAVKESPVPEPTTLALLCAGGLCLVLYRQRKRR